MPLDDPIFDSRTYREILDEALRRIPVHNPEWNNHSSSDPGVTLLQLFAFMTESIVYRANRIPERNRRKFLKLLGLGMRPPAAARGLVEFSNPKGPASVVTLGPGQKLHAGAVPFFTSGGLDVLPVDYGVYYKSRLVGDRLTTADSIYQQLYASFALSDSTLEYYETKQFEPAKVGSLLPQLNVSSEAVDGLWLALFARPGDQPQHVQNVIANRTLSLGIVPQFSGGSKILEPEGVARGNDELSLKFAIPNTGAGEQPTYKDITPRSQHNPLLEPAVVELKLPEAPSNGGFWYWDDLGPLERGVGDYPPPLDEKLTSRLITWIRIHLPKSQQASLDFKISWLGINAQHVEQRARVAAELLPKGTGASDQKLTLANTPVLLDSARVTVNGEAWQRIDDLNAAGSELPQRDAGTGLAVSSATLPAAGSVAAGHDPESARRPSKVYLLDRESGELRFGDGVHGARPPREAVLQASYDFGGGKAGLVGIGSIKGKLSQGVQASNPVPTWGGDEGESVAQAEKRIPEFIRHRETLVSREDYERIARAAPGVDLGRIEVVPLLHPDRPRQPSPGLTTVMVIPRVDPRRPHAPEPDALFLQAICEHLAPRRVLTTELHVRGPKYVDIWVSVAVEPTPGTAQGPLREAVRTEVEKFLSALSGGFGERGWSLEKSVDAAEISATATRVAGVAKVSGILLGDSNGERSEPLQLVGLELPRLAGLSVVSGVGDPVPIDELRGTTKSSSVGNDIVPVPVIPESC